MTKRLSPSQIILLSVNAAVIIAICVLNYFYQLNGFDFTLKCICSGLFASLGAVNLIYALTVKRPNARFYVAMAVGLVLAFLGDVLIKYDFVVGAATFGLGHVAFIVAYCFLQGMKWLDLLISGVLFTAAGAFLLVSPILSFDPPFFRIVCLVYALIIATMLGKALGNFLRDRTAVKGVMAVASFLFVFSDLMLVLAWFTDITGWTNNACMGTYYPALCLLALSMMLSTLPVSPKQD